MRNRRVGEGGSRGITLIELLVVVGLMGLFMGGVVLGLGATTNARIKGSATTIAGAVRVAFSRSASTSKSVRVVFDLDNNTIAIEEADLPMLIRRDDKTRTSGAQASTPQELAATKEAERISKGPTSPRAVFRPVRALGFETDEGSMGRALGGGVAIRRVEVAHAEEPITSGRAYLYFWPGGQTERAAIQLGRAGEVRDDNVITVLVSPLTGRVRIEAGAKSMERSREDSEREDRKF